MGQPTSLKIFVAYRSGGYPNMRSTFEAPFAAIESVEAVARVEYHRAILRHDG
jgi:hypothetical protein